MKKLFTIILAHLAKKIIKKYDPKIIGITGSVGKTSTKDAVFEVLKDRFNVRKNIKNYNTEIGLPLTIIGTSSAGKNILRWIKVWFKALSLIWGFDENYPEILILEMAADHPGDIKHLTKIAPCNISVVTAVSETHLEFFKDVEAVRAEKEVLVSHLSKKDLAILNWDDDLVKKMIKNTQAKILTFGFLEGADIRAFDFAYSTQDSGEFSHLSFKINHQGSTVPVRLKNALAKTHVYNFLAAVAVALSFDINLIDATKKLADFKPPQGRMNLIAGIKQTRLIDDTYNSSPRAAKAALEVLAKLYTPGKKIAVLGDMLELGSSSEKLHQELGQTVCQLAVDMLVTVGERTRDIARGAEASGMGSDRIFSFDDNLSAGKFVQDKMERGDLVLIKGSQGIRMEKITKEIMAEPLRAKELLVRQTSEWLD